MPTTGRSRNNFRSGNLGHHGILQSSAHWQGFLEKCSKLKSDFSYSIESVFDTFPWPQFEEVGRVTLCAPSDNPKRGAHGVTRPTNDAIAKIDAVAAAARELRRVRAEALPKLKGGLRALYRTLELTRTRPLTRPLRAFCFTKFLSPFPKRLKCPARIP